MAIWADHPRGPPTSSPSTRNTALLGPGSIGYGSQSAIRRNSEMERGSLTRPLHETNLAPR
eukprot:13563354-Alexandrium_andersonii.AAC.1